MNHGFEGIPVGAGAWYRLSLFARRPEDEHAPLTVRLDGSRSTYAEAVLDALTGSWTRHEAVLILLTGTPAAAAPPDGLRGGGVRLDTVNTPAEYADLRVSCGEADYSIDVRARKTGRHPDPRRRGRPASTANVLGLHRPGLGHG